MSAARRCSQDMAILTGGQVIAEEVGLKLDNADARPARHGPQDHHHQGRHHHRRRCRRRAPTSTVVSRRSRPRSTTPTPTGTARSSRSVSPSWPAASPSSRSARPPRSSSRRRSTASRTPCRRLVRPSRKASSPVAAPPCCGPVPPSPQLVDGSRATRPPAPASCYTALDAPARLIADNAGHEGAVDRAARSRTRPGSIGFNAATGEMRGPHRGRRHRPGQGDPCGAAERSVDRRPAAHHRGARRRQARGAGPCRMAGGGMGGMGMM